MHVLLWMLHKIVDLERQLGHWVATKVRDSLVVIGVEQLEL